MQGDPFSAYRNPTAMVGVALGLLVLLGGLWLRSGGLAVIGGLAVLLGGRTVEWLASEQHATLREGWGRFLDDLKDQNCLLLNVIAVPFLLFGFWSHNFAAILAGGVIGGVGHYYARRGRTEQVEAGPNPPAPKDLGP